jgi:O-antigen/teichoic acid export membrane protein
MNDFIFRIFIKIITFGYESIFHEKMSDEVKKFFKNLSYVGLGTIIGTIFSFTFNILAGRILGPSGYGEFTLVQSVAMFLYIPMVMGFGTAMVKYNAEKEDYNRQHTIISTTYILVFVFTIVSIISYYLFQSQILNLFSVSREIFYLSVVFAVLFVFYTLTTSTLRGLHEMKKYAIFQPIYGVILLSAFLVFIFLNFLSFKSMVFSMCLAYGITGGVILAFLRKYLRFEFDKNWANRLTRYGSYAIIGGVSSAFYLNIDKILINKYMAIVDVGIYRAYSYSFITIIMLFIGVFVAVFFPVASKHENKGSIFKRINKIIPYIIILGLPLMIGSGFIILKLYGGEYPFDMKLALLFAIAGICISIDSIYGWLMNAVGRQGAKITSFAAIILALANIFLNVWLIPLIGIEGAIIATIVSYILSICIVLSKRKYFYNSEAIQC